jgi:hypothetical protein
MNFRISLLLSMKCPTGILIGIVLNLYVNLNYVVSQFMKYGCIFFLFGAF